MSGMFHTPRSASRRAVELQEEQLAEIKRAEERRLSEEEQKRVKAARIKARGRGSTILTSGMGVLEAPPVGRKRLLGE